MGAIGRKLRSQEGGRVAFRCPGCGDVHGIPVNTGNGTGWTWNGDGDKPTFTPSLLTTCGHYCSELYKGEHCWCTYNAEHPNDPAPFKCYRCHIFVTNGMIQFLGDCSHELANQTVEMPDWDEGRNEE